MNHLKLSIRGKRMIILFPLFLLSKKAGMAHVLFIFSSFKNFFLLLLLLLPNFNEIVTRVKNVFLLLFQVEQQWKADLLSKFCFVWS